jgi:phosphoglycolate phosphatase
VSPSHRPRAIVFDFDLTLVDSRRAFIVCHEFVSTQLGLPKVDSEVAARSIGTALPVVFRGLFPDHEDLLEPYLALWQDHADKVMTGLTVALPGSAAVVHSLHAAGFRLGIVSQKRRYRVEEVLARESMLDAFTVVLGGDDVPAFKPDPSGILLALERLQTPAVEALYVGDTAIDAEAASRAGVPFVGVLTGYASRAEFAAWPSLAILESAADLPAVLHLG